MTTYSSWIKVSDFLLTVEAEDYEEAWKKMEDRLKKIIVILEEKHGGWEDMQELGCKITNVTEGIC